MLRNLWDAVWQDLKFGARQLRLNPGFTAVAVLSLALGIGANAAIFQLVDAIRLRTIPVEKPEELGPTALAVDRALAMGLLQMLVEQPDGRVNLAHFIRDVRRDFVLQDLVPDRRLETEMTDPPVARVKRRCRPRAIGCSRDTWVRSTTSRPPNIITARTPAVMTGGSPSSANSARSKAMSRFPEAAPAGNIMRGNIIREPPSPRE